MKKLFLFFTAVFFTAISANVFAQDQTAFVNATHTYSVASHVDANYTWTVYDYDSDYLTEATLSENTSAYSSKTDNANSTEIKWDVAGSYVVEVKETNDNSSDGCSTIRRFHVVILDLDILVTSTDVAADYTGCNTTADTILGSDATNDDDDVNTYGLATMIYNYEVTLYTATGGGNADNTDILSTLGASASNGNWQWQFVADTTSTTATGGSMVWEYSLDGTNYSVLSGTTANLISGITASTVNLRVTIQNVATDVNSDYVLDLDVLNTTVNVDIDGDDTYTEGQEQSANDVSDSNDGSTATNNDAFDNDAYTITIHSIPNTSIISFE